MSYGLKYLLTWESARGNDYKIEVFKKNYLGNSIAKKLGGAPFLVIDNSGNGLCGTSLQFTIQADTDGELNELYTTDGKLFKVLLYRNSGVVWSGYLLQELYSEDYIAPPYDVAVTATDQLALLKDIPYTTSGRVSIFKVISNALAPTLLDIGYTVQCSLRPSVVASSYPFLDSVTVDDRGFAEMSCYEVLEGVLTTLNMRLQQINNTWGLIRENDISAMLHKYSSSLGHISSSSAVATMIGQMYENDVWPVGNLVLTKQAAKKGAKFSYTPFLSMSILDNPRMTSEDKWSYNSEYIRSSPSVEVNYRGNYIKAKIDAFTLSSTNLASKEYALWQTIDVEASEQNLKLELAYQGLVTAANNVSIPEPSVTVRLTVQIKIENDDQVYYLTRQGWGEKDNEDIVFTGSWLKNSISAKANKDGYNTSSVEFPGFPISGKFSISFRNDSTISSGEHPGDNRVDLAVSDVYITMPEIQGYNSKVVCNPSAAQEAGERVLLFSDAYQVANEKLLHYNHILYPSDIASHWLLAGNTYVSFYQAMIQDISNSFGFVKNKFSGTLSGTNLLSIVYFEKYSSSAMRLESGVYDLLEDELNGEWVEITPSSVAIEEYDILTNEGQKITIGAASEAKVATGDFASSVAFEQLAKIVNTLNSIIGLDENDDAYIKLKKIKEEVEDENGELVEIEKEIPRNFYSFGEVSSGGIGSGNSGGGGSEGSVSGIDVLPLSQLGTDIGSEDLSKTFSAYAINSIYNDVKTLIGGGGNYLTKELADTYYAPLGAFNTLSTNFNALNTKITDFFSNEEDVDTTINRWKELEKFLQDYTETSTLADLLADKADKLGVDNLADQVALNMVNIETLTNTINSIEPIVVSNVARIGVLETKVGENELNIQANHEQILELIDNYHIVDSKFENLKDRIEVIESWFTLVDSDEDGVDDTLLCTQYNFASYGEVSSGGIGSGSSGGGGGSGVGNILPSTSLAAYGSTEKLTEVFSAYTTKLISDRVGVLEERNPINLSSMWGALASSGSEKIDVSHIPDLSGVYLPKTGGTINSKSFLGLVLNSSDTALNQLQLRINDEIKGIYQYNATIGVGFHYEGKGGIYVSNGGLPIFVSSSLDKYILYHSGNFNPANYLLLTGGTISNSVYGKALTIHRSDSNYDSVIKFSNVYDGLLGYIGISGSATTQAPKTPYYSPDGNVLYPLIHSGNIGSHIPDLRDTYLYMPLHRLSSSIDLNTLLTGGGKVYNYGNAAYWQNAPAMGYGSVFQLNSYENKHDYLAVQLAFDINHSSTTTTRGFWYRTRGDVSWANANWKRVLDDSNYGDYALPLSGGTLSGKLTIKASGYPYIEFKAGDITRGYYGFSGTGIAAIWDTEIWQTLIHSGNIASYNAGSATKLQTARTIWGQSFDGTQSVSGGLKGVNFLLFDSTNTYGIYKGSEFSGGLTENDLVYSAQNHRFFNGSNYVFTIKNNGNILIGTTTDNGAKLQVAGLIQAGNTTLGNVSIDLNRNANSGNIFDSSKIATEVEAYADYIGFKIYGADGSYKGTPLALTNSNVGIGNTSPAYKLDVAGTGRFTGLATLSGGLSATTGSFSSTLSVSGKTTLNNVDINANYELVCNGTASFTTIKPISANTYDLGTDFFRWNNAYINTLDLSGNISVGGALSVAKTTTLSGTLSVSQLASFHNVEVGSGYSLTCYGNGYFTHIYPQSNNTYNLGSSSVQWNNLFAQNINCATGELNISAAGVINFTNTAALSSSTPTIYAPVITTFYLLAPNGGQIGMSNVRWENVYSKYGDFENSIYIGSARVWWDSENDCLRVSKNFASDGEVSSGGVNSDSSDSESSNAPILGGTISGDLDVTGKVTIGGLTTMNSGFLSKSIQVGSMNNDSIGFGNCSIDLYGSLFLNNPTTGKWASFTISDTSEMVVINRALSVVSLTQTSDIRFKQVIEDVCLSSEIIANAPMFRFTWADNQDGKVHIGTSAQYWIDYAPELTAFVDNKYTLDYATLGVLMGKSNATEIEQLKERVRILEQEVECYRRMLNTN